MSGGLLPMAIRDRDYLPVFEALLAAGARVQDGWLAWLERQSGRPPASRLALRNYYADTEPSPKSPGDYFLLIGQREVEPLSRHERRPEPALDYPNRNSSNVLGNGQHQP